MNSPVEKTEPVSYRWTEGDYGEWKFANCAPDDGADLENFEPLYSASTVEALTAERDAMRKTADANFNMALGLANERDALLSRVERMEKALKPFSNIAKAVLAEAPHEALHFTLFHDCNGLQYRVMLDAFRQVAALQETKP